MATTQGPDIAGLRIFEEGQAVAAYLQTLPMRLPAIFCRSAGHSLPASSLVTLAGAIGSRRFRP